MKTKKGSLIAGITICALTVLLTVVYVALSSASVSAESTPPCDIEKSYAKEAIEAVTASGLMSAQKINDSYYFFPTMSVSRSEIAKVLCVYLELDVKKYVTTEIGFADEAEIDKEILPYIRAAVSGGYIKLNSDYTFRANDYISREEAADIFGALCTIAVSAGKHERFSDFESISPHFEANAKKLIDLEIMIGYPDDTFRPKNILTREELALILYRMTQNENFRYQIKG